MMMTFSAMQQLSVLGALARFAGVWRRIIGAALALVFAVWLSACSTFSLGYNQGATLGWWWLDGYADFSPSQKTVVQQALADWFAWHRQTQLADYAALLAGVKAQIQQPVSAEQACAWVEQAQTRLQTALEPALPSVARVAPSLSAAQLQHIQQKLAQKNREFRQEHIEATEEERREERQSSWRKRYEDFYGPLNPAQQNLLADAASQLAIDPVQREAEHLAHQRELLALLRSVASPAQTPEQEAAKTAAQAALARFFRQASTWGGWGSAAWRAQQQRLRQGHCELFARMQQASTPRQREHAAGWLQDWQQTLLRLAAQGKATATP